MKDYLRDTGIGQIVWCSAKLRADPPKEVRLLAWSIDYEELREGVAMYPVAVIEDLETRKVLIVHAERITFI